MMVTVRAASILTPTGTVTGPFLKTQTRDILRDHEPAGENFGPSDRNRVSPVRGRGGRGLPGPRPGRPVRELGPPENTRVTTAACQPDHGASDPVSRPVTNSPPMSKLGLAGRLVTGRAKRPVS